MTPIPPSECGHHVWRLSSRVLSALRITQIVLRKHLSFSKVSPSVNVIAHFQRPFNFTSDIQF